MISISRTLSALLVAAMSFSTPAFADESASSAVLPAVLPAAASTASIGATTNDGPAYGPELEGFDYPYPVSHFSISSQQQVLQMAYMDVASKRPNGRTVVLFDYQPGRGQEYPRAFLSGYEGQLMTDGYAAWRTLEGPTHFGCLAHARRAFVDALKGMKKPGGRAAQALEYFKALYQVEALAKDDLPEGEARDA